MRTLLLLLGLALLASATAPAPANSAARLQLGLLKYNGGGDWYANPTALPNLAAFCNRALGTDFALDYGTVDVGSAELFNYPWVHMTGHGNVVFSSAEAENLRNYLIGGGFLHIDDNYGMDPYVRVAMQQVFPEVSFVELPFDHPIYHQTYSFSGGVPKIHEHDGEPARGYGLFWEDRLVCFYSYSSDLGDGWEDESVHNDPPEIRAAALQMGANVIEFAFKQ
ncbi:hypothetical protein GGR26_000951 [Lewinella marina]|uniref:DUF4159 domain-containing protein n=1 Tax=Neolewinella marina TaxID=438751 RepID=A0A2G0CI57_9BACT|nr:DUF4159 domain-containing protein [Neolewinella marina]NJB85206.1 hypothetical protein [Neolewinella marina]PHK99661.1 hypothetical protein CGL56_01015 [Neolewinella marina]